MTTAMPPWRLDDRVFALAGGVAPPLAVLAPYGMAVLLPIVAVAALVSVWRGGGAVDWARGPLIFAALFGLWAGVSLLWTPAPGPAATVLIRVLALAAAGLLACRLAARPPILGSRRVATAFGLGLGLAGLILAIEYLSGNHLSTMIMGWKGFPPYAYAAKSQLNRGATVMVMLIWPLGLMAWRWRSGWLAAVAVAVAGVLVISDSLATQVALAAGGLTLAVLLWVPAWGFALMRASLLALALGFPLGAHLLPTPPATFQTMPFLPLSSNHRLVIWQFAGERVAQHPLFGWGMDASRDLPGGDEEIHIELRAHDGGLMSSIDGPRLPLHPHNAFLQWWLELGLIGAGILGGFLWWLLGRIQLSQALDAPGRAVAAASVMAAIAVSSVAYGFWQNWWLSSLWVCAAWVLAAGRAAEAPAR